MVKSSCLHLTKHPLRLSEFTIYLEKILQGFTVTAEVLGFQS